MGLCGILVHKLCTGTDEPLLLGRELECVLSVTFHTTHNSPELHISHIRRTLIITTIIHPVDDERDRQGGNNNKQANLSQIKSGKGVTRKGKDIE
jgi:hypothetical protein